MTTSFRNHAICIDLSPESSSASPVDNQNGDATIDIRDPDEQAKPSSSPLTTSTTITIQCLSELTPLDMMDMSFGIADPTGNCVWLGAFLFMEFFSRDLNNQAPVLADENENENENMQHYWSRVRSTLFPPDCHAIELGAGTGMAGLSLMALPLRGGRRGILEENMTDPNKEDNTTITCTYPGPSLVVQTDANDDALELCRINRDANIGNIGRECVHVMKLEWGEGNASKVFASQQEEPHHNNTNSPQESLPTTYDVVFATDVLYDLGSLVPLVATASELLKESGYFILSHVPRASIDTDEYSTEAVDYWQQLESIIINEASKVRLCLTSLPLVDDGDAGCDVAVAIELNNKHNDGSNRMILRPSLLSHIWGTSSSLTKKFSWQKMKDVGAAVLVFQKKGVDTKL